MVEIQCVACGGILKMPPYVIDNTDDFDGEVLCQECKSRLHLKLVKEKVLKYKLVENFVPAGEFATSVTIGEAEKGRPFKERNLKPAI